MVQIQFSIQASNKFQHLKTKRKKIENERCGICLVGKMEKENWLRVKKSRDREGRRKNEE